MKGYYFSTEDCKLGYGDGREISAGTTHSVGLPVKLCKKGLHASISPLDALKYAPGSTLWLVELSGDIKKGVDKVCAERRTYLHKIEAKELLEKFARECALDVIHLWDAPKVVIDYLQTGEERLRAAARAAALEVINYLNTAEERLRTAAWYAARAGARVGVMAATRAGARAGVMAAEWYSAPNNLKNIQEKRLKDLIDQVIKDEN